MFDNWINIKVDKRLQEILGSTAEEIVDRYAREAMKSPILSQEPREIITRPGMTYTLYEFIPRGTVSFCGGYVDLFGMSGEDQMKIEVQLRLSKDMKWRKFQTYSFTGTQETPLYFLRDILVVGGIRVTLEHQSGIGKKIYHCFYRRAK